ncbi:MAG: LptF/LptG family permease [Chlamydiales bacterium]|nr:LptF/LptG family permease [Chlamydiia bacterium]MCP5508449.1 LptF/LptG family permease [Chlamydiales bacterium]
MTIIWRYLLSEYFKVLIFCVLAIIAVLLTTRIDDIAQFATIGPELHLLLTFIFLQIPYILPIALPIACLISAIILIQQLSHTHELTALRASGLSLWDILSPLLCAAALLSCINFYFISELATESHLTTGLLKNELNSINPLALAQNKHIKRAKGFFFETAGETHVGESAKDIVFAIANKTSPTLNLLIAQELTASKKNLKSTGMTLISSIPGEAGRPSLIVENSNETTATTSDFSQLLHNKVWTLSNDHLNFAMLRVREYEESRQLHEAVDQEASQLQRNLTRIRSEFIKRYSVAFAVFSFTLMGATFGINISRNHKNRGIFAVISLATLYLICFFAGKSAEHHYYTAASLFIGPHIAIIALSLWMLERAAKGVE